MWLQRWRAISISIEALAKTATPYLGSNQAYTGDSGVLKNVLVFEMNEIIEALREFHSVFGESLPPPAEAALSKWLHGAATVFRGAFDQYPQTPGLVALGILRSSMERHLADTEAVGRSVTERAFLHLKRSIVVDSDLRAKWQAAFDHHETACEELGAIHLLLHGIWAFKADGAKGRTDLVFGEPLKDSEVASSAPAAVVLTEWKLAKPGTNAHEKLQEAKRQADLYKGSIFADLELTKTRYLVVVTTDHVELPDIKENGITYRAMNIPVAPSRPSAAARRPAKQP